MAEPENLPASIGRYEVKRLLGGGAMGNVWLAEDPRIKRKVAVKTMRMDTLRNEADRVECLARFQREAEVSGLLNHPGIVTIYDVGESELGPFLAMEYVPGRPLDVLVKANQALGLQEKLRIIAGVAEALDHAHQFGVIHRDVKPGNVMITEDGRPKLMDFGIAKREDASLTQTGTFLGTPSYASPEQIREGTVDNRSDIFSFGVMAFEILSGQSPFPGNSINTILYRIVNEPPVEIVPPVLGVVPDGWKRVFGKVLSKLPADRYPTCIAFVRDLMDVTSEIGKDDRRELLGILHLPGTEPGLAAPGQAAPVLAAPVLNRAHEETAVGLPEPRRGRAPLMIAAAAMLAVGGGGAWLFLKGRGGESLQVVTRPEQAKVFVDGRLQESLSPTTVQLRPGARLRIERKGFEKQELTFDPGRPLPPVLELKPVIREILVTSIPEGASINVDGTVLGTTPMKVKWNEGKKAKFTLSLGKQGFVRDFDIGETPEGQIFRLAEEGEKQQVIDARSEGILRVAGAFSVRARIDGKDLGELSTSSQHTLPPGKYKVELSAPKVFYKATHTVQILAGQPHTITLPGLVKIVVDTFPTSDMVTIDGLPTDVESNGQGSITVTKGPHIIGFAHKATKVPVDIKADGRQKIKL